MTARKTKKNADQKPLEHEAPKPIQVDQPATVIPAEGKAASPEHKNKTATKTHWVPEGKDRTLCGIFHLDPRMHAAGTEEEVTCAVCLKVLAGPSEKKPREKAERIVIQCADCGAEREIYAYQYGTVTRCETCQKRYRRRKTATKRRARVKARKAEKRLILKEEIGRKADDASILLLPYQADKAMLHAVIREARALLGYKK